MVATSQLYFFDWIPAIVRTPTVRAFSCVAFLTGLALILIGDGSVATAQDTSSVRMMPSGPSLVQPTDPGSPIAGDPSSPDSDPAPPALPPLPPLPHSTDSLDLRPIPLGLRGAAPESSIRWRRLIPVSTLMAGAYTGVYIYERQKWWTGQTPFHFDNHLDYAKNFDKLGHFYVSQMQTLANTRTLEWTGLRSSTAGLMGGFLTLVGQTNVEIHDGYSYQWGFDAYDQLANVMGVAWFYAHDHVPALRRFDIRLMYWDPERAPINQSKPTTLFTDDYRGMSYWVSMRVWDLLPQNLQPYWPRFLKLSAGVSLHQWEEYTDPDAYVATHISVDIDWRKIIPRDSWIGRTSGDILNRYHLPAPAIQVTPQPGFKLIFVNQ